MIKTLEKVKLLSKMWDGSVFLHNLEQMTNLFEIYYERKHELCKLYFSSSPSTILDIGAHIGVFSIKKCREHKDTIVYAIEPAKENYKLLRLNVKLNNLEKRIFTFKIALSRRRKGVKLYKDEFSSGNHSLFRKTNEFEIVKSLSLDEFFRKNLQEKKVSLIKIDTEGAEYEILMSGKKFFRKNKPKVIIETHPWIDKNCEFKILNFLEKMGYKKIIIIGKKGKTIFGV